LTLFFTYKRFSFGQFTKEISLKRIKKAVSDSTENVQNSNIAFHFTEPIFNKQTNFRNWLRITKFEFLNILTNRYFIAILFAGIAFLFSTNINIGSLYDTNTYPVTYQVIELLNSQFFMFILIIITFFTGELIWRERGSKLNEIFDALPLKNSLILTSKFSALVLIEFFIMIVILVTGIIIQINGGYYNFELNVYFKSLFLIILPNYILYTMLAFFVHILVNNKFFAHAVVVIFFLFNFMMAPSLFEHNLLIFGANSSIPYSDMNGFGNQVFSYTMFKLYWFAFAIILMFLANLFFVRGTDTNMTTRLAIAKKRINKPIVISIIITLIIFIFIGAYIFYNTNVLNDFTTKKQQIKKQYNYEINYNKYQDKAHPRITDVYIETHIFPHQRKLHLIGNYKLKNKTKRDVDTIILNINHTYNINTLNFSNPFEIINENKKDDFKLIVFNPAIQAGDSLLFDYDMLVENKGFSALGGNSRILTNGTFIDSDMFPSFGYKKGNEIVDRKKRKELELPPTAGMPEMNDSTALMNNYVNSDADWIHYEAVVSTSSDQIGITSGDLVKEWKKGDRNYYHYKLDQKVLNFFAFMSAKYEVKKDKWNDIPVEVYYQKGHEYNVDYMLKAMKMSLEYCSKNFSPYQFNQLRIFEFPRFSSFVQAFPGMIPFSEAHGFIAKIDSDVDAYNYPFFIAAHETAHQWWAHQVVGAGVKGATTTTEMLAQYSALMVVKQDLTKSEMIKLLNFFLNDYLQGRSIEKEKESTMLLNENQRYLNYDKSILVMNTLVDFIGEDSINSALANYIKHVAYQEPPYTTSAELIDYFKQVTPDSLMYLYTDLFEKITLYSNRTDKAEYKKLDNGKYEVNLSIEAKKFYADSIGNEEQTTVDEWIDVVVFAEDAKGKPKEEIYCKKHKINHEKTNISIVVDKKPATAGVDPYYLYIDKITNDNVIKVTEIEE
jgi:ABC-type transport system involved in multi-copper enzyme maturation permease subunit/extradiol dioxygenase family protein